MSCCKQVHHPYLIQHHVFMPDQTQAVEGQQHTMIMDLITPGFYMENTIITTQPRVATPQLPPVRAFSPPLVANHPAPLVERLSVIEQLPVGGWQVQLGFRVQEQGAWPA